MANEKPTQEGQPTRRNTRRGRPTDPAVKFTIAERRRRAVVLRIAGATWQQIANQCGYAGAAAAHKDITRLYEQQATELTTDVTHMRILEGQRLDAVQLGLWNAATHGDVKAAMVFIRLSARRGRVFGFDAAVRVEAEIVTQMDQEIEDLIRRMTTASSRPGDDTLDDATAAPDDDERAFP